MYIEDFEGWWSSVVGTGALGQLSVGSVMDA